MSAPEVQLSVVLAAYNEESVIGGNLQRILSELNTRPEVAWELICVDDGSDDRTGRIMDDFAAKVPGVTVHHHRRNFGQGRALRTAFDICRGEIVVTLDADLSYGQQYIFSLYDAVMAENVEIALASPYTKGGTVRNVPFYRRLLSRAGNWYLARMSNYPISTSTCVVRAYRREVLDGIVLTSDGMELQLEVLMKASLNGYKVCEVPADLAWAEEKVAEADFRRVSKMRILRTIRLYLLMGWLARPAMVFIFVSLLALLTGGYMTLILSYRIAVAIFRHMHQGFFQAVSSALQETFALYTYSFVFCGGLLFFGILVLAFSLLLLQNKFYFEELYRMGQQSRRKPESPQ